MISGGATRDEFNSLQLCRLWLPCRALTNVLSLLLSLSLSRAHARFLSFPSVGNVEREGSFRYARNLVTLPQG